MTLTRQDAVVLICRVVGLYMLVWACVEITYLPRYVLEFSRETLFYSPVPMTDYYRRLYFLELLSNLFRTAGLLILSALFFKAGPRVQAYLLPATKGGK